MPFQDFISTINSHSGIDFGQYSECINHRLENFLKDEQIHSSNELQAKLKTDELFHVKLIEGITVRYTEIFRDPDFYLSLKNLVLPYLSTFPSIKILVTGCATGEEVYSLAIILHECNLLHRSKIIATDINPKALDIAKAGIYHPARIREYTVNYMKAGGRNNLGKYYSVIDNRIEMNSNLKVNVDFVKHDILKDPIEDGFNLILCRNVLYYFKEQNQRRVVNKLMKSIRNYGYFTTGISEQLNSGIYLKPIDERNKIFRKVI